MASERGRWSRFKSSAADAGAWAKWGAQRPGAMWSSLGGNRYGSAFRAGAGEAFGFQYGGMHHSQYKGILGLKGNVGYTNRMKAMGRVASRGGSRAALGLAAGVAGRALIPAFTAMHMYSGYKEGGLLGAAKAGATEAAIWGGFKLAGAILGGPATWAIAGAAAGGYGYYAFGEASRAHMKGLRNLEMGAPVKDPYGTTATLRARSLQALNSSAVNGRMALGNEALLMYDSAYSPARRR